MAGLIPYEIWENIAGYIHEITDIVALNSVNKIIFKDNSLEKYNDIYKKMLKVNNSSKSLTHIIIDSIIYSYLDDNDMSKFVKSRYPKEWTNIIKEYNMPKPYSKLTFDNNDEINIIKCSQLINTLKYSVLCKFIKKYPEIIEKVVPLSYPYNLYLLMYYPNNFRLYYINRYIAYEALHDDFKLINLIVKRTKTDKQTIFRVFCNLLEIKTDQIKMLKSNSNIPLSSIKNRYISVRIWNNFHVWSNQNIIL